MSMRSHTCGQVTDSLIGQEITLAGWVNRRRDHGGVIFIDLRDREGFVQVVCDPDRPDMFKEAEGVRNEYCIQIKGLVRARPAGTENSDLVSGKVEILCHNLHVLNASVTPPFQLDDDNPPTNTENDLAAWTRHGAYRKLSGWFEIFDREQTFVDFAKCDRKRLLVNVCVYERSNILK